MKTVSASEFRTTFHRLAEPYEVTVLNRVIGIWTPVQPAVPDDIPALAKWTPEYRPVPKPGDRKPRRAK